MAANVVIILIYSNTARKILPINNFDLSKGFITDKNQLEDLASPISKQKLKISFSF